MLPAVIVLAYLVCAVFWPIVGFEFVFTDVAEQVVDNSHVHGLTDENLKHILTPRCGTSSYYPVRSLTYALDYEIWGLNPGGFKLTNGTIHLANVLLVFWLILRFFRRGAEAERVSGTWWEVSVATFSAGVFAVHPVVVQPVAWVAGREELLMTLGALGCFHFHLSAHRLAEDGGTTPAVLTWHALATFCCLLACLSNAVGAVIPLLVTAWDVLTLRGPRLRRILYGTFPLWVIAAATITMKKLGPSGDTSMLPKALSGEWLMLVLGMYWMNVKTLVWPMELALVYGCVLPQSFLRTEVILGGLAIGVTCAILWMVRRRKSILFGLVWFGLALGPSSQIMLHHVPRADRFLYLPLVGLTLALATGLKLLRSALKGRAAVAGATIAGVLTLLLLNTLSALQVQTWRNSISVWENCVRVSPKCALVHCGLAENLARDRQLRRAFQHYQIAVRLDSRFSHALRDFALSLATCDQEELRDYDMAIRVAKRGCELTEWKDPAFPRALAAVYGSLADAQANRGEFGQAVENYHKAIEAAPSFDPPWFNLAFLLATCRDERFRRPDEAVGLAERAAALGEQLDPHRLGILATVYAEAGRLDMAVATAEKAIGLAQAGGNAELADLLRDQLKLYRHRVPADSNRH